MSESLLTGAARPPEGETPAVPPYDVAIVGAGPAGLATALALRRHDPGRSIVVLAGPTSTRRKIGETLPPGAQAVLRSLGVWEEFLASEPLAAFGTSSAWGRDRLEENEFIFHPDRRGWHIDRRKFDAVLLAAAERCDIAIWRDITLVDARRRDECWNMEVRQPHAGAQRLDARFVVDATGRAAHFASQMGVRRVTEDQLVAVCVNYLSASPLQDTYALVEARPEGWWYSAVQPDGRLAVACFTDADLARDLRLRDPAGWRAALQRTSHTRARVAPAVADDVPALRPADSGALDRPTGTAWLATGDAVSTFDPLSSQGVMKALRQGALAAYAAFDHLRGDAVALPKYAAFAERAYREFIEVKRDFYRRETRWPDAPFWARRRGTAAVPEPELLTGQIA